MSGSTGPQVTSLRSLVAVLAGSTAVLTSAFINGFNTVNHATDAQGGKNGYVTITYLLASS